MTSFSTPPIQKCWYVKSSCFVFKTIYMFDICIFIWCSATRKFYFFLACNKPIAFHMGICPKRFPLFLFKETFDHNTSIQYGFGFFLNVIPLNICKINNRKHPVHWGNQEHITVTYYMHHSVNLFRARLFRLF